MDWSPILISMRTAGLSIVFTFFMGILVAWMVVRISNPLVKTILDGIFTIPLVLPPTVAGFFLLYVIGVKRPVGQFFFGVFQRKDRIFLGSYGAGGGGHVLSADVPFGQRRL